MVTDWKIVARIAMKHEVKYRGFPAFDIAQRLIDLHQRGKIKLTPKELEAAKTTLKANDVEK